MNEINTKQSIAILFADIGGSTELYESIGDAVAHKLVARSLQRMEVAIENNSGTLLRTVGDAALASFPNCDMAYHAAKSIQEQHSLLQLSVRIGFHYGPVIPDKGDVYGNAVNIAARIASLANLNEITTTESSVLLLSPALRQKASLLDVIQVKGINEPLPVYRLFWRPEDDSVTAIHIVVSLSIRNPSNTQMELNYRGKTYVVNQQNPLITIGRTDNCNLKVNIDCASRTHASIELVQGKFYLSDKSTNGTYVIKSEQSPLFIRRESIT
ncbi:MAG: adenylate/guanylate cyclase domain-containing protein, partial [Deltaproteobacteria bacterium]|nr:adenylate/guanylate cyclase domain-containing protein [Deltaproteobacteria bacterium]